MRQNSMVRKGYTLVELLISMVVFSVVFGIMALVIDSAMKAYTIAKQTLQRAYAENYVSFLFDVLEWEIKWVGSGGELMRNLRRPTFTPGVPSSYNRDGTVYATITNVNWYQNSFSYERQGQRDIIYINYVIPSPIILKRNERRTQNSTPTYSPLMEGSFDAFNGVNWCIVRSALSPNAPGYFARYVKLRFTLNSQPYDNRVLRPNEELVVEEINLANQVPSADIPLRDVDLFIYPIARFKRAAFNTGYLTRSFRQVRIIYDRSSRTVYMERFLPALDIAQQVYTTTLLDNVAQFSISVLYRTYSGTDRELDIYTARYNPPPDFSVDNMFGLKFRMVWESPWMLTAARDVKRDVIVKERIITIVR